MKSQERHKLKENEFARTRRARARRARSTRRRDITWIVVVVVALLAIVGGYCLVAAARTANARTDLLGERARGLRGAGRPAAGAGARQPPPVQQPGTFLTEQAKLEAALAEVHRGRRQVPEHRRRASRRDTTPRRILANARPLRRSRAAYQEVVSRAGTTSTDDRQARPRRSAGRAEEVRQRDRHLHRARRATPDRTCRSTAS